MNAAELTIPTLGLTDATPLVDPVASVTTSEPNFKAATSEVLSDISDGRFDGLGNYAMSHLAPALMIAAAGLAVIFLGYLFASYLSKTISKPICRRVDETLGKFIGKMIFYTVMFSVTGAVLSYLGTPLGGLAAAIAAAGFAIGLAFQGTLSNFASGVMLLIFRPFKVGDVINAAGVVGKVNEVDLFTTTLDTPDNRRIIVPNSAIAGGTIENISYHSHRRLEVVVGVDYSADQDATRSSLQRAVDALSHRMIEGEDRGAAIILSGLGDSAVEWKVRMWVGTKDFFPVTELLTSEVKRQLDAAGIGIPFPQMDIHLNRVDEHDQAGTTSQLRPKMRPTRRDSAHVA